jgi:endonuclease G
LAFFRVEQRSGSEKLARPVKLARRAPRVEARIAVIGYPAQDPRIPEPELMRKIFDDVFETKRLAPGAVTSVRPERFGHDSSTLGGNSGSLVLDLSSGEAVGVHFSGGFLRSNFAVRADIVADRLATAQGELRRSRAVVAAAVSRSALVSRRSAFEGATMQNRTSNGSLTFTIPVTVTVSLGGLGAPSLAPVTAGRRAAEPALDLDAGAAGDDGETEDDEATAASYRDRKGYDEDFLGEDMVVSLPRVVKKKNDVLTFENGNGKDLVLRYQHFSVVMSKSRRLCFFSAVNIDGGKSKKTKRPAWRFDPRIPKALQIKDECYGNPPKFSRGHMTRREDPAWGSATEAALGNDDSMHVTNAVPQMQAFNSPIWLALEDYALQHAREDKMAISVFTGPYFKRSDPTLFGVKVPTSFWKIIAFVHDDTGELCATGYEMADDEVGEEFVFGQFTSPQLKRTTQVSIAAIAAKAGLDLGELPAVDAFADEEEAVGVRPYLESLEQIRFIR